MNRPFEAAVRREADFAECARITRRGSRSFFAASCLLPADVREAAYAVYAFCREADDLVDLGDDPAAAVAALRARLDRAYGGRPDDGPVDRAFAETVEAKAVPKAAFEALIEGLEWDAAGRTYETLADLEDYAARVAGAVGVMMATLMGARGPHAVARASDLGAAMQLTNIARDVGEDARAGRVYLPTALLAARGVDRAALLAAPAFSAGLGDAVDALLVRADVLYDRGLAGVSYLPAACRPGIRAAGFIYREIGERLRAAGCDSVSVRTVVPTRRKLSLLAAALAGGPGDADAREAPPSAANAYLVDAALSVVAPESPSKGLDARLGRAMEFLSRLDRSEDAQRGGAMRTG